MLAELRAADLRRAEQSRASMADAAADSPGSRASANTAGGNSGSLSASAVLEIDDERWRVRVVRAMCRTLAAAGVSAAPAEDNEKALGDDGTARKCLHELVAGQRKYPEYEPPLEILMKLCAAAISRLEALSHEHERTAMLGDAVNAAVGEFARAQQLDALQRVTCWLGAKQGDGQKHMFPALLVTLVTGEKTYLPDSQQVRKRQIDKDGSLERRTKHLVCEMLSHVGIGGGAKSSVAFKLSLWALLTGERAAYRSACTALEESEKKQSSGERLKTRKLGALAPVLRLVTAQDEELTQKFISEQLNPIAQRVVDETVVKLPEVAGKSISQEISQMELAYAGSIHEQIVLGSLQIPLPEGGSVLLEVREVLEPKTTDKKQLRCWVRTTLPIKLPPAAAAAVEGTNTREEVELKFWLDELLGALASTLTGDLSSYMKLIGGGRDTIREQGAKLMDKRGNQGKGIYHPLIQKMGMTPLFKMISSLASGRAEGVAARIDDIVELACTVTNVADKALSTSQAASSNGDAIAERRKASIAAFSAWVRGFSRLMRREPVPPELITEMAKGIQLIMNEPTEGGLAGASVGLALAFEGVLGVLDGDIEAFARLAAMFGAQDEKATTQAVLTIISRFRAAFDARKEASAPKSLNSTMNRGKEMATAMVLDQLFMAISKGDGVISFDDFRELCKFLHLHLTREEAARVFALADASSTGGIDRNEFAGTLQIIAHRVVAQVLERLHISPEYLVFFFVYTVTALVLLLAFIFTGIFAFATGTDFGAVVNSILPIGGGACLGQNPQDPSQLKELIETVVQSVLKDMQV